jgi:calcium-translocating P-type ATPase
MTPDELDEILPKLQVLARSSPDDKHTLVTRLNGKALPKDQAEWEKEHPDSNWESERSKLLPGYKEEWLVKNPEGGEVVGVTGDGTNDAPALKAGDVGLSMGLSGTEVAKEASDIVILDDKFSSIVKAALWGRSVYDNIRKFLQFQLTVNVVALALTFLAAVLSFDPPLNAVMMLWVNLIMDTMGALALGTEPPQDILLQRMPYKRNASLVSKPMWRNIFAQSIYQLILLMVMLVAGADWFGVKASSVEHNTLIFNAFVFCQLFNEFNARSIKDDGMAAFRGVTKNPMFLFIIFVTIIFQIVVVYGFGPFTKTTGLSFNHFVITMCLGLVSIPLGFAMRWIPVEEDPESFAGYNAADLAEDPKTPNPGTGSS